MRVRKKKNAAARIQAVGDYLIGDIKELEGIKNVHIEIGCGKGMFVCELARRNPDIAFIAVEKSESVMVSAMERAAGEGIDNIKFFLGDILCFEELDNTHFVDRIYLNFSDPWHRTRHSKRRLTAGRFIDLYKKLLTLNGSIHMKTDNEKLFDFSVNSFAENDLFLSDVTRDLHKNKDIDNIMTEYETNFVSQGLPIYALKAHSEEY